MDSSGKSVLQLYFMLLIIHLVNSCPCGGCVKSSINQAIEGRGFDKHIIKTLQTQSSLECATWCNKDCSCQAFQIHKGDICDLLHEGRQTAPKDFKQLQGYRYYEFENQYINQPVSRDICPVVPCENNCCKSQPCQHNGVCKELCVDANQKFNCTCSINYTGKYCEVFKSKSCNNLLTKNPGINSGHYIIYDNNGKDFPTFCEFNTDEGISWTLVESFAFKNRLQFKKPFYVDNPVSENTLQWDAFRLSMSRMKQIISTSTHFRATCNYHVDGLSYTDYIKAKISAIDLLNTANGCYDWDYINVRGHSCTNCNSLFANRISEHPHTDSYYGALNCLFKEQGTGALHNEDDFGNFDVFNPAHRCSSSESATTQWWIGS